MNIGPIISPPLRESPPAAAAPRPSWVNLDNLDTLEFSFPGQDGTPKTGWSIYAEPNRPDQPLGPVHQLGAPGEGFSCVDDVARVALVDLDQLERTKNPELATKARAAVEFCLNQADGQGHFYNFVNQDGSINKTGPTSAPGLNWWSARAFWALSKAERVLGDDVDPRLKGTLDQTVDALEEERKAADVPPELKAAYAETGVQPGGLVDHSGSITSIFALGMLERLKANPSAERERSLLTSYGDAMCKTARPDGDPMLGGMHANSMWDLNTVHLYGNTQVKALADAGTALGRPDWIASARKEADLGYPRVLSNYLVPFAFSPSPEPNPQIAYAAETTISNLQAVYRATGEEKYSLLAGLYGTWFNGANAAGLPLYHPETGRTFDGLDGNGVSRNSGAESNVETQIAMSDLEGTPGEALLGLGHVDKGQGESLVEGSALPVAAGAPGVESRTLNGGAVRQVRVLHDGDELAVAPQGTGFLTWKSEDGTPLRVSHDGAETDVAPHGNGWQVTAVPAGEIGGHVKVDSLVDRPDTTHRTWTDGTRQVELDAHGAGWNISESKP